MHKKKTPKLQHTATPWSQNCVTTWALLLPKSHGPFVGMACTLSCGKEGRTKENTMHGYALVFLSWVILGWKIACQNSESTRHAVREGSFCTAFAGTCQN